MRERPGSLAVPPFGAAERLTVPDPLRPVVLPQCGRSRHNEVRQFRQSTDEFEGYMNEVWSKAPARLKAPCGGRGTR